MEGPFYKPGAPRREATGKGFAVTRAPVKSAAVLRAPAGRSGGVVAGQSRGRVRRRPPRRSGRGRRRPLSFRDRLPRRPTRGVRRTSTSRSSRPATGPSTTQLYPEGGTDRRDLRSCADQGVNSVPTDTRRTTGYQGRGGGGALPRALRLRDPRPERPDARGRDRPRRQGGQDPRLRRGQDAQGHRGRSAPGGGEHAQAEPARQAGARLSQAQAHAASMPCRFDVVGGDRQRRGRGQGHPPHPNAFSVAPW